MKSKYPCHICGADAVSIDQHIGNINGIAHMTVDIHCVICKTLRRGKTAPVPNVPIKELSEVWYDG